MRKKIGLVTVLVLGTKLLMLWHNFSFLLQEHSSGGILHLSAEQCYWRLRQIHRKTPVRKSLFNTVTGLLIQLVITFHFFIRTCETMVWSYSTEYKVPQLLNYCMYHQIIHNILENYSKSWENNTARKIFPDS